MNEVILFSKICRICLSSDVKKMYMSISDKYREFMIADYILLLTNVEIKPEEGFPNKICSSCFEELEIALHFKQKCENSEQILKTSKDKIIEKCAFEDVQDIIIVKKEEPYEKKVEFEEVPDDDCDEYNGIEALEETSKATVKSFNNKAIDLNFECHDCSTLFKSKCKLRTHWKRSHSLPSLLCGSCKLQFKTYKAYQEHKRKNSASCRVAGNKLVRIEGEGKSRIFHCTECNYSTAHVNYIKTHILIHSGERPYQCEICQNKYKRYSSLQSHLETAHKKYLKVITCHICKKQVKGRTKIYRHMQSHTVPKEPCPVCQKPICKSNLKHHLLRHANIKSHTCDKCASKFYTLSELCNHRRSVHNKLDVTYKCDLCDYTAYRSDRIKVHRGNHTDSNVPCMICGMFYPNVQKMEAHRRLHFAEKDYECPYCDLKFFRKNSVGKHIRRKHRHLLQNLTEQHVSLSSKMKQGNTKELFKIKDRKKLKQK